MIERLGLTMAAVLTLAGASPSDAALTESAAPAAALPPVFAPPLGARFDYRVTSRRLGRDGMLIEFTLHYDLVWKPLGRGFGLDTMLTRIESDAPPSVRRVMTGLLEPLVGLPVSYLLSADGKSVDLVDPDTVWALATPVAARLGQASAEDGANGMAGVLLALPQAERNRLLTADVRSLIATANPAIPRAPGATVSIRQQDDRTIIVKSNADTPLAAGGPVGAVPLTTESTWTIDDRTGLVVGATVQNWVKGPDDATPTLVEEHIRALMPVASQ